VETVPQELVVRVVEVVVVVVVTEEPVDRTLEVAVEVALH
jgi:hypothetical protein